MDLVVCVMKLKTLKDLDALFNIYDENEDYYVRVAHLRSAARKWVKHYEKMMEQYSEEYDRELYIFNAGKRASMMDFFNLE